MECIDLSIYLLLAFGGSILAANFASWKMEKNIRPEIQKDIGKIAKWKLLLGDVFYPSSILTKQGIYWRRLSVIFFICIVLSGVSIPYFNNQEWVCKFK